MIQPKKSNVKVFVVAVNDKVRKNVLKIIQQLRTESIPTDFDIKSRNLSKQLEYANSLKIPYAVIVGEKELKKNSVKLRNMNTGKEKLLKIKDLLKSFT